MYLLFSLIFIYLAPGTLSSSLISPCKVNDFTCIENSVNAALPLIFDGIPELGVESSDPLLDVFFEARLPTLNITMFNSTFLGFKNTKITNLTLNDDITIIHCDVYCINISLDGHYELNGDLISLPVYGKGGYHFNIEKYLLNLVVELEKVNASDGTIHLFIKNIKTNATPLVKPNYEFKNLFNGQKDLADVVHKFVEDNWLKVTVFIQDPFWNALIKKVTGNVNKYLEYIPLQNILLN